MTWGGGGAVGSLRVQNRAVWVCVISVSHTDTFVGLLVVQSGS